MSDKISKFEYAPLAKRVFAAIMDGAVFMFVFLLMALWVFRPIANAGLGYRETSELGYRYQLASHLYLAEKQDDNGNKVVVEVKDSTGDLLDYKVETLYYYTGEDISFYVGRVYYYYHNYKTGTDIELPQNTETKTWDAIADHFVSPDYKTPINGVLPVKYYTNDWFSKNVLELDKAETYFKIDDTKTDYVQSIVLIDEAKKADALKFLRNAAYEATKDFYFSDYYQGIEKTIERIQLFIFIPPFVISFLIFYFLFPLIFKGGETLGKKTMHLAVISFDGYKAKKRQIILRETILLIAMAFCAVVVGIGLTSIAIMALGTLILFIITLFSKYKRSPHDFAAYTIVVDGIHSVWFDNPEDEARHQKELDENMSKYNKFVDESHLLQKGTEILDEGLKKEVEDNQNKTNSKK